MIVLKIVKFYSCFLKVIIVQFGGYAFSTASLTIDQWLWCIFLGFGTLVWGQLITTIPTKRIPKTFTWGSGPPEEMAGNVSLGEDGSSGSLSQDVKRTGQILWIRGLTRLQTQVCYFSLNFFISTISYIESVSFQLHQLYIFFLSNFFFHYSIYVC